MLVEHWCFYMRSWLELSLPRSCTRWFAQRIPRSLDCKHNRSKKVLGFGSKEPPWTVAEVVTVPDGRWVSDFGSNSFVRATWRSQEGSRDCGGMADFGRRTESGETEALEDRQAISVEELGQEFLSDPSHWRDNRFEKNSPRSPEFRHFNVDVHDVSPDHEYNGMAGLNQAHLFVGHQIGSSGGTPTIITAFERGPTGGLNKNFFGTCGEVRTLCKTGRLKEALHILNQPGIRADSNTYLCLLEECINTKGLAVGKQVHAHIFQSGFKPSILLLNTLVKMYAKCGSVIDARQVFDKMPERDMFTWTMMMAGYAKHGFAEEAFKIYQQMQREGVMPDRVTFICVLNACASLGALEKGKQVHADMAKVGIASYINLETALVNMYAKCGSMKDARQVFDTMAQQDVVSWSAMIAGYAQHGCSREAFEIYEKMQQAGVSPNRVTFICILNACANLGVLDKGKEVHADIIKAGLASYVNLETALVDMYVKCRSMKDARQVFDSMAQRDVVSWNAMIAGYAQLGCGREAFEIYEKMQREGVKPDRATYICALNACAMLGALEKGKEIHADIITAGIASFINLETALVNMYAKCGSLKDVHQVFNNMAQHDVVTWNAVIAGYAQHGHGMEALDLFAQMQQEGLKPNGRTFISLLSACSHVGLVDEGRHYFKSMSRDHSLSPTVEHYGCMVDLLSRAGQLHEAEDLINKMPIKADARLWRALLGACRIHGDVEVAERVAKRFVE